MPNFNGVLESKEAKIHSKPYCKKREKPTTVITKAFLCDSLRKPIYFDRWRIRNFVTSYASATVADTDAVSAL